jgi:hypothetical protein
MATLKESLATDLSRYEPVDLANSVGLPPLREGQPTKNPFLRCPMPPVAVTPDSLRQYYIGGQVPQFRILTPSNSTNGANSGGGTTIVNASTSTGAAAGTTPTPTGIVATNVSLTTAILNPNQLFLGSVLSSKSFQLLGATASSPCRIEVYGTQVDQLLDVSRSLDIAPFPGTQQNLITDLALDSIPYKWAWQNRVGANTESPQNGVMYLTITNLSGISIAITVSLIYVPLEAA